MFIDEFSVTALPNGLWRLNKRFRYTRKSGTIVVPKGFITDLTSIPRPLWNILPPWDDYGPAAIIHDWIYWKQPPKWTRARADKLMLEAMGKLGVGWWKRWTIYAGIRVGGWVAWNERKAANDKAKAGPYPRDIA